MKYWKEKNTHLSGKNANFSFCRMNPFLHSQLLDVHSTQSSNIHLAFTLCWALTGAQEWKDEEDTNLTIKELTMWSLKYNVTGATQTKWTKCHKGTEGEVTVTGKASQRWYLNGGLKDEEFWRQTGSTRQREEHTVLWEQVVQATRRHLTAQGWLQTQMTPVARAGNMHDWSRPGLSACAYMTCRTQAVQRWTALPHREEAVATQC